MDLVTTFNNLHGKEVSRSALKSLLAKAKKQKHSVIAERIANVLQQNNDTLFTIEIKRPVKKSVERIPIKKKVKTKVMPRKKLGLSASLGVKVEVRKNTESKKKRVVPAVVKKPIRIHTKSTVLVQDKSLTELEKLGFISANSAPQEAKDIFVLSGEIGKFLQKQQPHKALILIKGNKHSSKSQLAMQIANAFGEQQTPVAYIDYEQGGIESKDTVDSINRNTTEKGRKYIAIKGYLENPFQELQDFCKVVKVIIADSVTDLKITADQLNYLRTTYSKVIWCFISQVKENGAMYGGNKMAHNPTSVIHCSSHEDPKHRFATLEKNRGNDLSLKYSMYYKRVVNEPKKKKLSFIIN